MMKKQSNRKDHEKEDKKEREKDWNSFEFLFRLQ